MKIKCYQVDAFTHRVFGGNPAAVCPLHSWLDDDLLQAIAAENNLSETAFIVATALGYQLRWFTPRREVDLCGHATLAAAHVVFDLLHDPRPCISFSTRSGNLIVTRAGEKIRMDFPARMPHSCPWPDPLIQALGRKPLEVLAADDYIVVFETEEIVRAIQPQFHLLEPLDLRGVCITAPGIATDFVSRFFAPKYGIPEDPVTGSAHCELAPYWGDKLGLSFLSAKQLSPRGGEIDCELREDRVILSGHAVLFMHGEIELPNLANR
ncbi:MAG TPA: PhzF family phenazine biosynthesis protein [Rhodocyclaceae bacterium]|nr:PhzF family phenazine biosynthesis protein [Rhodocyclaceae bacterium]